MKKDTIIFDLGGVLVDWNPRYLYDTFFEDKADADYFLTHIATSDWNEEQDAGRSLADGTALLLQTHPEEKWRKAILAFYDRWKDMLGGPVAGTVSILKELIDDPRYRVLALTNWSGETWPVAMEEFDFLHWFEGVLVSGDEGMRKPANAFYQLMMDRYSITKEAALFIDDNQRNVDASNNFGLEAILFTGADSLRVDLKSRGILK